MEISLQGKTALVTGASRGIGATIAKSFAEAGAQVMLSSRKEESLRAVAKHIDGETDVFAANTGDIEQGQACVDATIKRFGKIDILVNNAATNPYYGETLGVDSARFDKTFQVNLKGPLFWSQAVFNASMQKNPGVILNIASVGGLRADADPMLDAIFLHNQTLGVILRKARVVRADALDETAVTGRARIGNH